MAMKPLALLALVIILGVLQGEAAAHL